MESAPACNSAETNPDNSAASAGKVNIVVLLTEYCVGGKIEKNEMGGACGAYGAGERGAQGSGGET